MKNTITKLAKKPLLILVVAFASVGMNTLLLPVFGTWSGIISLIMAFFADRNPEKSIPKSQGASQRGNSRRRDIYMQTHPGHRSQR